MAVAHDLGIARFQEATNVETAVLRLSAQRFDAIVIDVSSVASAFGLLLRLRHGAFASSTDTAIIALTPPTLGDEIDAQISSLEPMSRLRKPFKVAELLQAVGQLSVRGADSAQADTERVPPGPRIVASGGVDSAPRAAPTAL